MPDILGFVSEQLKLDTAHILTGNCIHYSESDIDGVKSQGCNTIHYFKMFSLLDADFITQPATFWTRRVWDSVGHLNEHLHFVFDWEWFLRANNSGVTFTPVNRTFALYREHIGHKTGAGGDNRQQEIIDLYMQFGQHENAKVFKNLIVDLKKLNSRTIRILKKITTLLLPKLSDIQLLILLYPSKYKRIDIKKLTSLYYVANNN